MKENYPEGTDMLQFKHLEDISHYNYNYFVGFNSDLLFAESDDDNTTEWYLVRDTNFIKLGLSYCSQEDKLIIN
ncbi:hypothetical protein ACH34C_07120 [Elizabethkingia anophelis]|uniref:hypothetical protein n=1 Tax=Elizabethkingia anophelis TaxID=1117645 RepID=UPI0037870152